MHNWLEAVPDTVLLVDGAAPSWNGAMLQARIAQLRAALLRRSAPLAPVALLADNSPEWLAIDLCTQEMGITLVPLPLFFTPAQWQHVIAQSGVQALFCARAQQGAALGFGKAIDCGGALILCENELAAAAPALIDVQKITFTSGTSATPKGVCLSTAQQWELARALHAGLGELGLRRHLCLLPFAVLLENIAGPYTAMLSAASTICPPLAEVGLAGSSSFDPQLCLAAIERYQAHSIIVLPQMLRALVAAVVPGDSRIASLRFVAVGGAKTPARLLAAASKAGFPVYEGYGLSECSSVVALNLPGARRQGSVGRALPGRTLRIAADGEIMIGGVRARYLGQQEVAADWFATGDLGHLDADGFLTIDGRKKDILITGFGRNVSPEWPEAALIGSACVAQALVVGDGQPCLAALIVPFPGHDSAALIQGAVDQANAALPDYAQVRRWRLVAPFTTANGQATANGRPRRAAIHAHYQQEIAALFPTTESHNMHFFDTLQTATEPERQTLFAIPVIRDALRGEITVAQYIAFLSQAYHHVKHTVPLLMACGARLDGKHEWLRNAIAEYIEEELGHQEWILSDIAACGADPELVRHGQPDPSTELMVAYAYHQIDRANPVSFFGMVHVLEGTSTALASHAADTIAGSLGLPATAFTYLSSHGSLDIKHVAFFKDLMNRLDDSADQQAVLHSARMMYRLYGDIFRSLPAGGRR